MVEAKPPQWIKDWMEEDHLACRRISRTYKMSWLQRKAYWFKWGLRYKIEDLRYWLAQRLNDLSVWVDPY